MRFLTALLACGLIALAVPALARETWTRFSYPEAGFSIEFPGQPKFTLEPDSPGEGTDRRKYALAEPRRALLATSMKTYPRNLDDLLASAQTVSSADGRTLIAQKVVTVQDVQGIESVVRSQRGNMMLHRVFYREGRMLQFVVVVEPDADVEAAGRRFHDSITFLP